MKTLIAILILLVTPIHADQFLFDSIEGPHLTTSSTHYSNAVVKVDDGTGSGTLFARKGQYGLVVTNYHVTGNASIAKATWPKLNHSSVGRIRYKNAHDDLVIFVVKLPLDRYQEFPVLEPLCYHTKLAKGAPMELIGYGSNRVHRKNLRLRGYVTDTDSYNAPKKDLQLTTQVSVPGDSGGAIVALIKGKPYLAGVNWGYVGGDYTGNTQGCGYVRLHRRIVESKLFRDFLKKRREKRQERRGGCEGFGCPIDGDGGYDDVADLPDEIVDLPEDIESLPPEKTKPEVLKGHSHDEIVLLLRKTEELVGAINKNASAIHNINVSILAIQQLSKKNTQNLLILLKRSKVPIVTTHYVVVADQNAGYWPNLLSNVKLAKTRYHKILVASSPIDANSALGELPQIIEYRNSIPVRTIFGRDVYNTLTNLSR